MKVPLLLHKGKSRALPLFLCVALSFVCTIGSPDGPSVEEIAKYAEEATVLIGTLDASESAIGQGSGFFVKSNLIVTNFHVIKDKSLIVYRRFGQEEFSPIIRVRGIDRTHDLALLDVSTSSVKPLYLSRNVSVNTGQLVHVMSYPKNFSGDLEGTFSSGRISNARRKRFGRTEIQIDARGNPGSSGGPVLNSDGDVIGVVWGGDEDVLQIFAIPVKHLKDLLGRYSVRLPAKPKRKIVNRESKRKIEEKAQAEVERAKADTEKAKAERAKAEAKKAAAEAEKAKAEAEKAQAEAKKADAERAKAEAEKAKVEASIAETETESAKEGKVEASEPKTRITDRLQAATVLIFGRDRNGNEGLLGSGFFVREDQVATDFHVIDGSTLKKVKRLGQDMKSADSLFSAQLLKTDKAHHLAILRVKGADVHPLRLANSKEVDIDEKISIVGDPSRGEFSEGTISKILNEGGVRYFEFDAPVSPGSSGGPIVNAKGEVIGVTALKVVAITGTLKNAIPSDYLTELLDGEGDPVAQPTEPPVSRPEAGDDAEVTPSTRNDLERLLGRAIKLYEKTRYNDAIKNLESVMFRINDPETRAIAHLYLGFSKWGLEETESSVNADFREALRYNPDAELPPRVGQNHQVFKPLLELARRESLGTLTVSASPPETEIWLFGGEMKRRLLGAGTASIRLFKGTYAIEGVLVGAHKVMPVLITPDYHKKVPLVMETEVLPSHEFELTLDIFSAEKPKAVIVRYTMYDTSGNQLGPEEKKEMQLQEHKPESSIWVYHVTLPSADQGGRIVYRIEADGKVIRDEPIQVQILEPPTSAFFEVQDTIPVKARVVSAVAIRDVRVYYDAPGKLSKSSPAKLLKRESDSNTYTGEIPVERNRTDGDTWFFVAAAPRQGHQSRSATRAVRAKPPEPDSLIITLEPVPNPMPINKPINITAEVKSGFPLQEVRVYYDFPRKQLTESSPSTILEDKKPGTYVGRIPKERTREAGYIWYFVSATTANEEKFRSEDSVVEVKDSGTRMYQGVWASHSWSNLISDDGFYSGWERGNVMSLAFLQEGRGFQTLGVQLDYTYDNPDYISAMAQWGPSTRENPVAFAFLAGATGHRSSDPSFSRVRQSRQFTPLLGGSVKFYPHDRVVVDATASVKLQSENGAADRESSLTEDFLHHYEAGIRLYISPTLNLRAGYGRWRLGEYDNASVQVGLGATF